MKLRRSVLYSGIFFVMVLAPLAARETLEWLWKIEGETYTQKQFEKHYEAYLILAASQMNLPLGKLKYYLEPQSGDSEQLQKLREQMSRENFADNFKTVLLVDRRAKEEGYLDDPVVAARRDFFLKYFTAQLYLMEYLEKNMPVVTESEVMDRWIEERKNDPQLKSVTIENGLKWAREQIEREKMVMLKQKVIEALYQKYKVEDNPAFSDKQPAKE